MRCVSVFVMSTLVGSCDRLQGRFVYMPGAHDIGVVLAVPQLLPRVQALHSSAAPRLLSAENEPAGQGSGSAAQLEKIIRDRSPLTKR